MPTLSVCIIVKNEEMCIQRSLQSIQRLVDELIIVDTGSTDKTISIAQQFTDKIFSFSWNDDFSAARNFALLKATGDWILVLDADEVIAAEDHKKIRQLIEKDTATAYFLHQKEYTNDTTLTGFQYSLNKDAYSNECLGYVVVENAIRLFRRAPWIQFSWRIHESVTPTLEEKGILPLDSGLFIHHYKQEKGKEAQHQKMLRYLTIGEQQILETPHLAKPHYEVGLIYYALGRQSDAIAAFQRALFLDPSLYRAYYKLGRCFVKLGRNEDAHTAFEKYLTFDQKNSDVYGELGLLAIKQGKTSAAEQFLKKAIEVNSGNILARHNLSLLLLQTGRKQEGVMFLHETEKEYPNPFVYNMLGVLAASAKDYATAKTHFEKGIACSKGFDDIQKSLELNLAQVILFLDKLQ